MTAPLIGVDVGGTKIAAAAVTPDGFADEAVVFPTPASAGPQAILETIATAVTSIPEYAEARGVGVGTGGVIDHERGVVISANDLLPGWAGTHISDELQARLRLPIRVDNDVNAFAMAEWCFGAGRGYDAGLYVSVGTGIGGGIVLDGRLYRGSHYTAGELGHFAVPGVGGQLCNCGRPDHLEALAAGPAISRRYAKLSNSQPRRDLREITNLADSGDEIAARVITDGAFALGRALAGIVNAIDLPHVVVGGGVAEIGPRYWDPLISAFNAEVLSGPSSVWPVPAKLGVRSAVVGAAALLLEDEDKEVNDTP